jgi:hypothetical protein
MKIILSIIIGYNFNNLLGSENDAILIYNIFYRFYLKNNSDLWIEPKLFIGSHVNFKNIKDYIINIKKKYNTILFFFSGHGSKNKIFFQDNKISKYKFYSKINKILQKKINLYIILDSCYSESFLINNNIYKNFNQIYLLASSKNNQKSSEGLVNFNKKYFQIYGCDNTINNKIVLGIFTYNFSKLLYECETSNINQLLEIKKSPLWNHINLVCNQLFTIVIIN